jgi:hypothetical protein
MTSFRIVLPFAYLAYEHSKQPETRGLILVRHFAWVRSPDHPRALKPELRVAWLGEILRRVKEPTVIGPPIRRHRNNSALLIKVEEAVSGDIP